MGVVYNLWKDINLICEEHKERLTASPEGSSFSYICPKRYQKEMCKLNISTKAFEGIMYALSDLIISREKSGIEGLMVNEPFTSGRFSCTVNERDEGGVIKYDVTVSDKKFSKK